MTAPHLQGVQLRSGDWQRRRDDVDKLIEAGRALTQAYAEIGEDLIDEAWDADLVEVRQQYATKGTKWWRIFSGDFRRARTVMQGYHRGDATQRWRARPCRHRHDSGQSKAPEDLRRASSTWLVALRLPVEEEGSRIGVSSRSC